MTAIQNAPAASHDKRIAFGGYSRNGAVHTVVGCEITLRYGGCLTSPAKRRQRSKRSLLARNVTPSRRWRSCIHGDASLRATRFSRTGRNSSPTMDRGLAHARPLRADAPTPADRRI